MKARKPIVGLAVLTAAAWIARSRLRSEHPVSAVKLLYKPVMKWAAQRALIGRHRSRQDP